MDIEGKYFPDEEDENQSKGWKKTKKVFKYLFYTVALLVYIIFFVRIFLSCDAELLEEIHLSDKAVQLYEQDKKSFEIYAINTKEFMNYDGTVQLKGNVYAKTANELEIGIKYNNKITKDSAGNTADGYVLEYYLRDSKNNIYEVCNRVSETKNSYKYERVSFGGVELPLEQNDLNVSRDLSAEASGAVIDDVSDDDALYEDESGNIRYYLVIKNPITNTTEELLIYDNSTTYRAIEYR